MKLIIRFILCFLLFGNIHVYAKQSYQFLGLGDSITTGYGISDIHNTYVNLVYNHLVDKLVDKNIFLNNEAIDGLTSTQLLDNVKRNNDLRAKIYNADLIILSIGGNDYLSELTLNIGSLDGQKQNFIGIGSRLIDNLKNIYNNIFDLNSDALVLVVPLYNPYILILNNNADLLEVYNQTKDDVINQIDNYRVSAAKKIYTSNTLGNILENSENLNKGIDPHPNIIGHKLIAQECIRIFNDEYDNLNIVDIKNDIAGNKDNFISKYKYYLITLGLIVLVFITERRYNNSRK